MTQVKFDFEDDIEYELQEENFSKAVMMAHDWLQKHLYFVLSAAYTYTGQFKKSMQYTELLMQPRSMQNKHINAARKLDLITDYDVSLIKEVKAFRDKKVGHDMMFFDQRVKNEDIPLTEVKRMIKVSKEVADRMWTKTSEIQRRTMELLESLPNREKSQ